jgi:hypothetical protein
MRTIQKILVLALVALALWCFYNATLPKPRKMDNTEVAKEAIKAIVEIKTELNSPSSGASEIAAPPPEPVVPKQDNPSPLNLDSLPPGEFVITKRVAVVSDSGIKGFAAGERVKKVDGGYSNGKITLPVPDNSISNSRSLASNLAEKLKETQGLAHSVPVPSPTPTQTPQLNPPASGAVVVVPNNDAFNASLDRQIEALESRIRDLSNRNSSQINANGPTITRLRLQIEGLERQRR